MHDISSRRISMRELHLFAKLCGDDALRSAILVTAKWGVMPFSTCESRQRMLEETVWKQMLEHGAQARRFNGTFESAWEIIDALPTESMGALLIQEELVTRKLRLSETQAEIFLGPDIQALKHDALRELRKRRDDVAKKKESTRNWMRKSS
jgi:hypothetical protein